MTKRTSTTRLNFTEYFRNKAIRNAATYVYNQFGGFYSMQGELIPEKLFDALYPVKMPYINNPKGQSIDSRSNFY